jgi:hypothetical protein
MLLTRIFLRDADSVEVENIVVPSGKPDNRFIPPREPASAVEPMLEMPDDAISHLESEVGKHRVQDSVERNNGPIVHVIPNLPANTSLVGECAYALLNDQRLLTHIVMEFESSLIGLADVVWR